MRGYTEAHLADGAFAQAVDSFPHDYFIVASDDILIRRHALDQVVAQLKRHPVVTGYSQRSHTDWTVNLTAAPLEGDTPRAEAYQFLSFQDIVSAPTPTVRTWFTGMSLTGMNRELWQRFPFDCYRDKPSDRGYASDFHLSLRLQQARVPIMACRDAFAYHWRHEWRNTNHELDAPLLTGTIKPHTVFEP